MVFKLKTSKETLQIFNEMGSCIHLQPFALCKLSIALSLRDDEKIEDFSSDCDGLELNRQTITGEYDELFKALIVMHSGKRLSDEEYFPKYLKAHIDRGARKLKAEYKYNNSNFYEHLSEIEKGL